MMKALRLPITATLLSFSITTFAQQPADCSDCTCDIPMDMLGSTLSTASNDTVCEVGTMVFQFDASRYGRIWGDPDKRYTISTCSTTADTRIYVTSNTTIPGVIMCDDDGCGTTDGPSTLSFIPYNSELHRIYVFNDACGGEFPAGTMIDVMITCNPIAPPPNDLPCGAEQLMVNEDCNFVLGTNVAATNSQHIVPGVGAPPSCSGALYQGADVWYTFTVPANGLVGIQTQEDSICAGAFQLYTATACNGTFTQLPNTCTVTGLTGGNSEPAMTFDAFAAGLAVGETIYLRYWERNGNENGTFQICAVSNAEVGIGEISDQEVRIFPNPNTGNFTIHNGSGSKMIALQLIDVSGRIVHSDQVNLASGEERLIALDRSIAPGNYQLRIESDDRTRIQRMIIH